MQATNVHRWFNDEVADIPIGKKFLASLIDSMERMLYNVIDDDEEDTPMERPPLNSFHIMDIEEQIEILKVKMGDYFERTQSVAHSPMTTQASTQTVVLDDEDDNQMNDFENNDDGWFSRGIELSDLDSPDSVPLVRSYAINIPLDRMDNTYYECSDTIDDLIPIEPFDTDSDSDSMPELEPIELCDSNAVPDYSWLSGGAEVDINGNYIRAVDMDYIRRSSANEKDDYDEQEVIEPEPVIRSYALNNEINGYKYRVNKKEKKTT
jgi:hypothetical protein